jgi:DNA-binding winged helix-turn-helix (wHTH) protein
MTPTNGEQYRFGPFQLDVTERELRRDGKVVALTAKTFDLLLILVQGAGRTFTKSELLESLWPGAVVEESNLSQTIFLLRKALGENGEGSDYIRTVQRRGYKFTGSVSRQDTAGNGVGPKQALTVPSRISHLWTVIATLAVLALGALAFVHFRETGPEAGVVRSTVFQPEKARFSDGMLALSPDGRRIAFALTVERGKQQLWIRPLDAQTAHPLEGTDGAVKPFWSPDSRWLGFFADGKLKKIDTQGGPPIALADAPIPIGGSWSRNGVILFSPYYGGALQQISSAGGKATPAVAAAGIGGEQCCPWFLPDGEHYMFSAHSPTGTGSRVNLLVGSLSSTVAKVAGDAANALYAQGRLLYLKESTLVAQPFDINALRTTGEPEAVVEGVGHYRDTFQVGFFTASSTGTLAYLAAPRVYGRQLNWFDRMGKVLGTVGEPRAFFAIQFSPDRKHLAATIADSGNVDIWTYDLAQGVPTRFTFEPAPKGGAVWSRDGRRIVFNSTRKGHSDLYQKSADGAGAEELLYADTQEKYQVSWSRDGKLLLYTAGAGSQPELWVLLLAPDRPGAAPKPHSSSSPVRSASSPQTVVGWRTSHTSHNGLRSTSCHSRGQPRNTRSRLTGA